MEVPRLRLPRPEADAVLARWPGPVMLRGQRRWFGPGISAGAVLFAAGIFSGNEYAQVSLVILGLAVAVPAMAAELILPIRLKLTAWGFEESLGPLRQERRWAEVEKFRYAPMTQDRLSAIAFEFRHPPQREGDADLPAEGSLYPSYGIPSEDLAILLNAWRERGERR